MYFCFKDDVFALDEYECARCLTVIKPLYKELTEALLRKSMLPSSDSDGRWTLDDREVFRCYRQDIADTMVSSKNISLNTFISVLTRQV